MAKKKEQGLADAVNIFEDAMQRASLTDYFHVDKTLISKSPKDYTVLIVVDQALWNGLIDNPEFKDKLRSTIDPDDIKLCAYSRGLDDNAWVELNAEELYSGKVIKLSIDNLEYELSVNKALIPLKLKKSEFNNIGYRVFPDNMILALKKRFEYPIEDHGFTIIRIFQIV